VISNPIKILFQVSPYSLSDRTWFSTGFASTISKYAILVRRPFPSNFMPVRSAIKLAPIKFNKNNRNFQSGIYSRDSQYSHRLSVSCSDCLGCRVHFSLSLSKLQNMQTRREEEPLVACRQVRFSPTLITSQNLMTERGEYIALKSQA
jgi:hypothetical protein